MRKIKIPKQNRLIVKREIDSSIITAPDGIELHVSIPQDFDELEQAWDVLEGYTKRICPNPEAALQELDDIEDVEGYHFESGEAPGYLIFTAVDKDNNPRVVTATEIASVNRKGIGFIYQIGHDKEISNNDTDFSAATGLYKHVADLLPTISPSKDWLGIATESRKEGPELEAILKAGFTVLVPNEFYRPPATQQDKIEDPENRFTKDLVLLGTNVPKEFGEIAARTYVKHSYCEGQDTNLTLELIKTYFEK